MLRAFELGLKTVLGALAVIVGVALYIALALIPTALTVVVVVLVLRAFGVV